MAVPSVEAAWSEWLAELSLSAKRSTITTVQSKGRRWLRFCENRDCSELTPADVRSYLISLTEHFAAVTVISHAKYIGWWAHWAQHRGYVACDLMAERPHIRDVPIRSVRTLTDPEMAALVRAARPDVAAMFVVARETGLRQGTLLRLEARHIDYPRGWVHIPGDLMKSGQDYHAPVSRDALDALRSVGRLNGRIWPMAAATLWRQVQRAIKRAGLHDVTFHDLRRTFFTGMRRRGVPLEVAMALSDHRDVRTALRHYRSVSPGDLLKAVGRDGDVAQEA